MKRYLQEAFGNELPSDEYPTNENRYPPKNVINLSSDHPTKQFKVNSTESSMYLLGFKHILSTVLSHESHLLTQEELVVLDKFKILACDEQYLFVRLFMRKRDKWFRVTQLNYQNCQSITEASANLTKLGFFVDENSISIEELLDTMTLEELRTVARFSKINGKSRKEIIHSVICLSRNQSVLHTDGQLLLSFNGIGNLNNQTKQLKQQLLYHSGSCVKPERSVVELFHRIHAVYFRSTIYDEHSLTSLILVRIKKTVYPGYQISRTSNVFESRTILIEYVDALELCKKLLPLFEGPSLSNKEALGTALDLFFNIYPKWLSYIHQDMLKFATDFEEDKQRLYSFIFSYRPGAVYTYLIHKGTNVLGKLRLVELEIEVLDTLLAQNLYLIGKRGFWYNRKALLEGNYKTTDVSVLQNWQRRGLCTCTHGIEDKNTHMKYQFVLQRRLSRLEKVLLIPEKDRRDFSYNFQNKPSSITIFGKRVDPKDKSQPRTLWLTSKGDVLTVEKFAVEYYASFGWSAIHSEGGIFLTLFALVFWDILFMDIPGVFQSAFQSAPLDLSTDLFFSAREYAIRGRLAEVENGCTEKYVKMVYTRESKSQPVCIGLQWSYSLETLLSVIYCIHGKALASIFHAMAQDYKNASSGMPDLCLWNTSTKNFLLSEVKSDNDKLSEPQKFWIDLLLSANLSVEVCHVLMDADKASL
ncbi:VRR-NUC nuclease associated domain-containing protein [Schizosaccharomyces cryophilus OY26]|uniref:Fanconi-associated nuclease n=1 Tax=Schizosaccharomyces cryophilus (strain OY26 / ATCC MYA-4695 / CBS 11777 / NBRC 106824 / NRRL Y48691) TaxID=653667 RepID=S9VTG8_SCHCR|nr:VRR-NUC nuclease associated domain-containing protein [Schizosaccharomyces cryophilus OY26]EPY49434.1 VRR-NUC nuclease associated domain-containing protein [Schizosaccharomyces cryophilus OY26]